MAEQPEHPLKSFSSKVMLKNVDYVRGIIQRIRQQEGGVGSVDDELALYRVIQDLDILVDIIDGTKVSYDELKKQFDTLMESTSVLQNQNKALKDTYEKMIQDRNDRIIELERALDIRPAKPKESNE